MQLNKLSNSPIYEQIELDIKKQIKDGILSPGDRLPSIRELATTLNINPNIVNRAYKNLEKEEFIITIIGKGTFIKNKRTESPSFMKEKELKLDFELLLLEAYYHNMKEETLSNWLEDFYSRVAKEK